MMLPMPTGKTTSLVYFPDTVIAGDQPLSKAEVTGFSIALLVFAVVVAVFLRGVEGAFRDWDNLIWGLLGVTAGPALFFGLLGLLL